MRLGKLVVFASRKRGPFFAPEERGSASFSDFEPQRQRILHLLDATDIVSEAMHAFLDREGISADEYADNRLPDELERFSAIAEEMLTQRLSRALQQLERLPEELQIKTAKEIFLSYHEYAGDLPACFNEAVVSLRDVLNPKDVEFHVAAAEYFQLRFLHATENGTITEEDYEGTYAPEIPAEFFGSERVSRNLKLFLAANLDQEQEFEETERVWNLTCYRAVRGEVLRDHDVIQKAQTYLIKLLNDGVTTAADISHRARTLEQHVFIREPMFQDSLRVEINSTLTVRNLARAYDLSKLLTQDVLNVLGGSIFVGINNYIKIETEGTPEELELITSTLRDCYRDEASKHQEFRTCVASGILRLTTDPELWQNSLNLLGLIPEKYHDEIRKLTAEDIDKRAPALVRWTRGVAPENPWIWDRLLEVFDAFASRETCEHYRPEIQESRAGCMDLFTSAIAAAEDRVVIPEAEWDPMLQEIRIRLSGGRRGMAEELAVQMREAAGTLPPGERLNKREEVAQIFIGSDVPDHVKAYYARLIVYDRFMFYGPESPLVAEALESFIPLLNENHWFRASARALVGKIRAVNELDEDSTDLQTRKDALAIEYDHSEFISLFGLSTERGRIIQIKIDSLRP